MVVSVPTTHQSPAARAWAGMLQPQASAFEFGTPLSLKGFRAFPVHCEVRIKTSHGRAVTSSCSIQIDARFVTHSNSSKIGYM